MADRTKDSLTKLKDNEFLVRANAKGQVFCVKKAISVDTDDIHLMNQAKDKFILLDQLMYNPYEDSIEVCYCDAFSRQIKKFQNINRNLLNVARLYQVQLFVNSKGEILYDFSNSLKGSLQHKNVYFCLQEKIYYFEPSNFCLCRK